MPQLYNGVDIIEVARVDAAIRRSPRFLDRVYTAGEREVCQGRAASFAAFFAAKEAAMKTLGAGMFRIDWRDIEVSFEPGGRPVLSLGGRAARRARELGISTIAVSLSHSQDYAVASAAALSDR